MCTFSRASCFRWGSCKKSSWKLCGDSLSWRSNGSCLRFGGESPSVPLHICLLDSFLKCFLIPGLMDGGVGAADFAYDLVASACQCQRTAYHAPAGLSVKCFASVEGAEENPP